MIVTCQVKEMYIEIGHTRLIATGLTYNDYNVTKSTVTREAFDYVGAYGITRKFKIQL